MRISLCLALFYAGYSHAFPKPAAVPSPQDGATPPGSPELPPPAIAIDTPTPATSIPSPTISLAPGVSAEANFLYRCDNTTRVSILKQNIIDAGALVNAALDFAQDDPASNPIPSMNFATHAAINFFGPPSKNGDYQAFIQDTLIKAWTAYSNGWFSDWWNNRYIQTSCMDDAGECAKYNIAAYTNNSDKTYGYPLVVFCPAFFDVLPSHGDVVKKIDADTNLQQNLANMRSRTTTFLHEMLHINWGNAQVCGGDNACRDHYQLIGGKFEKSYKTGRSKLLAQRNAGFASTNNDNYAYYAMARFMEQRWNQYPSWPRAWYPDKSRKENEDLEKQWPGAPPSPPEALEDDDGSENVADETTDAALYAASEYPDWYQPFLNAN